MSFVLMFVYSKLVQILQMKHFRFHYQTYIPIITTLSFSATDSLTTVASKSFICIVFYFGLFKWHVVFKENRYTSASTQFTTEINSQGEFLILQYALLLWLIPYSDTKSTSSDSSELIIDSSTNLFFGHCAFWCNTLIFFFNYEFVVNNYW